MSVKLTWNEGELIAAMKRGAERAVTAAAEEFAGDVKEKQSQPGRGRIRRHRAKHRKGRKQRGALGRGGRVASFDISKAGRHSAPGDPPAPDLGRLRADKKRRTRKSAGEATSTVSTDVEYARALEYGDPDRNLEPRPSWRPTMIEHKDKYLAIMVSEMSAEISKP